ncbi:probable thiol methyltransferase 2 [Aspergillus lentulus]|nr:probable thiol methyltransferase 2 [Aspergillus lentulus]GFF22668.1 probable thiol methyltransferase 2 [Aspergillus lentulus]GFF60734.1 probable thiol methyltransferase 2 [Aspergillus lentulus]GFF62203.1 probable thiol methyltransferase 2 [Aspergillus lentulus]GFF63750.1 probable thiol methyltransferase 2 [Aspergillus lentulus]
MSNDPNLPSSIPEFIAKYKENYVEGWAELWNKSGGKPLPFDRGFPNPALEDTLIEKRDIIGDPIGRGAQGNTYRKKALVPGCGRGVDVLLLASFGYDAYGLEYSATAVEVCKEEQAKNGDKYPVRDAEIGQGKITFVQGDFFKDTWLEKLQLPRNSFDLIYDYTFFCALDPSMRPQWALRHTQLLADSPRGHLICLEFPRHKDTSLQGPP